MIPVKDLWDDILAEFYLPRDLRLHSKILDQCSFLLPSFSTHYACEICVIRLDVESGAIDLESLALVRVQKK